MCPRALPPRGTDRAWNERLNGIKRQVANDQAGYFGVINLLGPRTTAQNRHWNEFFTFVQVDTAGVERSLHLTRA